MELLKQIDETVSFNEKNIRVIGSYEEPWFVAKDICNILELPNITNAIKILPEKWRDLKLLSTFGGEQNMNIINEAGLYKLIMRSNKPIAQRFQEVVCEEILPSLRKKGEYHIQSILDKNKKLEDEKNKIEEENKKLLKKYVKKPKDITNQQNVVYLMTTEDSEKIGEYVIGKSVDLDNRKEDYDHNKLHDFKVVYYHSCATTKLMDIVEATVLMKLGKYRCKAGRDVFQIPEDRDISLFTDMFDECVKFYEDVETVVYPKKTVEKEDNEKQRDRHKKYREENKEKLYLQQKEYREDNKEIIAEIKKEYYQNNAESIAKKNKIYYEENKEDILKSSLEHYNENKEIILEERKEYYQENKDKILNKRKEYYEDNYKTKIAQQRQKKETCECGMVISHYHMKKHKDSTRHIKLMEKKS
jgi:prophage antirepressor-like protein